MPLRFIAALAVCLSALAACASPEQQDPASPAYLYPAGIRLVLNQPFEIAADSATARFQSGRIVAPNTVRTAEPYCILEVDSIDAKPQRIEPDTFVVTKVLRSVPEVDAVAGFFIRNAYADDETPSLRFFKTVFLLHSDRQPGVRSLTCQHHQYAAGTGRPRHLTLPEIRQALGPWFSLQLPGEASPH